MTRNLQRMKPATHTRRAWLLAMGLALAPLFSAASWADNYNLQSVDFATVGDKTNIILHTGSIVPVDKVLVSDNKLILDIDQVNTDDTVHTNFAGASNISHVIMQPLNEHKIRMIIRGEGLGVPSVAFYNAGNGSYNNVNPDFAGSKLATQTGAALRKIQDDGTKPATFQGFTDSGNSASPTEKPVVDTTKPKDEGVDGFSGFIAPEGKNENTATAPAPTGKPALQAASETAPIPLQSNDAGATASDFFSQLLNQLTHGKLNGMLGLGLLGLALMGGGFTCYKVVRLKQGPPDLEDLIEEQAHGKRVSFREMASAYRSKHEPLEHAPKAGNRKTNAEDVIGLRSLSHMDEPVDTGAAFVPPLPQASPAPSKSTASSLEQMIAAIQTANAQKKPVNTPAPKKQAVNQYLQNQQAAKPKPKNRQVADELMIREQKRAQAAQQELLQQAQQQARRQQRASAPLSKLPGSTPVNRAAAAQKQIKSPNFQSVPSCTVGNSAVRKPNAPAASAAQGPLPGNPEVLNFLRNVADLMEKDGKGEIAKSIHKNLNPKNAGLIQ
jgi:hypothetical protein